MLTILMGRAKTGKSEQVLRRIGELGDSSRQILLVPEHASHQADRKSTRQNSSHWKQSRMPSSA